MYAVNYTYKDKSNLNLDYFISKQEAQNFLRNQLKNPNCEKERIKIIEV